MSENALDAFVAELRSRKPRLDLSDDELLELFWQMHPRVQFFKALPWSANLLDLGAGDGGLAHFRNWLKPQRPDLNLYGVDRTIGERRELYAGWEAIDLERQMPNFPGVRLNCFLASYLIEYLAAPQALIEWIASRAEPGARFFIEWASPSSLDLPTREQLRKFDIDVVASSFMDDWEHKKSPDISTLCGWLNDGGFSVIASGAIDLGILGDEMFARAADSFNRSMGYWSMTHSSLYAVAVKSHAARSAAICSTPAIATAEHRGLDRGRSEASPQLSSAALDLLRTKRALLSSGLFDAAFYRETYADIRASTADPLTHYITNGEAEGRSPNPVFFPRYYRRQWMADAPATQNALAHYAEQGERQGHKPHPAFDPQAYLAANPPLADFVDRPLFHYLRIGREAGLPVAPGRRGEALARILEAQPHASDFEYSGRRNHYQLMRYKQALVRELGVEEGFEFYKEAFDLPDSGRITRKAVTSLYDYAKERSPIFHEIDPGGEPFQVAPPRIIGEGGHPALEGVSRSIFLTCLTDARVRTRSGFIEIDDAALLDYQGNELARIDDELDFDPAVFHAEDGAVWMLGPEDEENRIELDEAFMLLGPHSDDFGHWMLDLLPRYIAASASGALPPLLPVLIDQSMPATLRECLRLMSPDGVEFIALAPHKAARVRRLWCASSQMHMPVLEKINERFRWDYEAAPPARFAEIIRQMNRRVEPIAGVPTGQEKVFLARKGFLRHKLVNAAAIEAEAAARGFTIVYPEDLSFTDQVRLLRHARFVAGPDGSQLLLAFFSTPGTKLLHLCHPYTIGIPLQTGMLEKIGIDVTVMEGPYFRIDSEYPEQSDYRIDSVQFGRFLDCWLDE